MSDHSGHRDRLRERLIKTGFEGFAPHEVLEYILFCFVPRRNTNDIAHRLLDAFGTLQGVCRAGYEQLRAIDGMTDNAALFLASIPSLFGLYNSSVNDTATITSIQDAVDYIAGRADVADYEQVVVLCLNAGGRILRAFVDQSGAPDQVVLSLRGLITKIAQTHAVNVIVGHNHPSGNVNPSKQDIQLAQQLNNSLRVVGVNLLDFIIVGQGRYYAFSQNGLLYRRGNARKHGYSSGTTDKRPYSIVSKPVDITRRSARAAEKKSNGNAKEYTQNKNNGYRPLFAIKDND